MRIKVPRVLTRGVPLERTMQKNEQKDYDLDKNSEGTSSGSIKNRIMLGSFDLYFIFFIL